MTRADPDRHVSLDVVRGVAVLGILAMNINAFASVPAAYFNPVALGPASPLDLVVYCADFVLFDGKMRGLFSFLFGASMLLVIERAEASGQSAARVHYARMAWLFAFGLAHLYLIWWGDILAQYALVGAIAFGFRRSATHQLVIAAVVMTVIHALTMAGLPFAVAMAQQGEPNPAAAARTLGGFARGFGVPDAAHVQQQLAAYRGDYAGAVAFRMRVYGSAPLNALWQNGLETLAYMLFGMAALRSGMLTGEWERRRYVRWAMAGFAIGLPVYALLAAYMIASDFDLFAVVLATIALSAPVRPVMVVGWACLILLLTRPGGALTQRLAAAGRMAFSNYIVTSLICTAIFYGHGLGWFARLSRAELVPVVLLVWVLILGWSQPWLQRFAQGPLEWLWRSLARAQPQPILAEKIANATQ